MNKTIKDDVYGRFVVESAILNELIESKSVQRLKKISQYGLPHGLYHLKSPSRYEHSIGVMLLLKKFGASEEEQIAGLLHDVSHTAFSHLVDWIIGSGEREDYQDKQHSSFLLKSEIPKILEKYGYDPLRIADNKNFTLLEQEIPSLCADRLDYSLREFPKTTALKIIRNLSVYKNRFVFKDRKPAGLYALMFQKRQKEHWGGEEAVSRYILFGNVLKYAIEKKTLDFKDLWTDDFFVIQKLKSSRDVKIQKILKVLKRKRVRDLPKGKIIVRKKFRYVDPEILRDNKMARLSQIDKKFKKSITNSRKENKKGIYPPVVEM